MRHAVMAAAVAFSPRLKLARAPGTRTTRRLARLVLRYLDRRRRRIDARRLQ